jgi:hypothetical protein
MMAKNSRPIVMRQQFPDAAIGQRRQAGQSSLRKIASASLRDYSSASHQALPISETVGTAQCTQLLSLG